MDVKKTLRIGSNMITIRPMQEADFPSAVEALAESFFDDPLFAYIAPDEAQRKRWLPIAQRANVRLTWPEKHNFVAADGDGKVLGVLGASPPGTFPVSLLRNLSFVSQYALLPNPWTPAFLPLSRVLRYVVQWEKMHWKEPHWYVFLLGVRPSDQGKGLGKRLMAEAIGRAQADGHPVYLETQTESNVPFYQSMGFEVTAQVRPQPDGPPSWGMIKKI